MKKQDETVTKARWVEGAYRSYRIKVDRETERLGFPPSVTVKTFSLRGNEPNVSDTFGPGQLDELINALTEAKAELEREG